MRKIRPRPLGYEERIPVVWLYKDRDPDEEPRDPGLVAFLHEQEAETQRLVRSAEKRSAPKKNKQSIGLSAPSITVPHVRAVGDYHETNLLALSRRTETLYSKIDITTSAFIRNTDLFARKTMEQVCMEYDMDEDDEEWLEQHNAKVSKAVKSKQYVSITPDMFEDIMEQLENMHIAMLGKMGEDWEEEVSNGNLPKLPANQPTSSLSKKEAARSLGQQYQRFVVEAIFDHWETRRKSNPHACPLLPHLTLQQPWKAITFGTIEDGQPELGDMPFCEEETKNSTVARFGHKMSKQDVHNIMQITRDEMENLRTLADQIRKRERIKRQAVKIAYHEALDKEGLPQGLLAYPPLPAHIKQALDANKAPLKHPAPHAPPAPPRAGRQRRSEIVGGMPSNASLEGSWRAPQQQLLVHPPATFAPNMQTMWGAAPPKASVASAPPSSSAALAGDGPKRRAQDKGEPSRPEQKAQGGGEADKKLSKASKGAALKDGGPRQVKGGGLTLTGGGCSESDDGGGKERGGNNDRRRGTREMDELLSQLPEWGPVASKRSRSTHVALSAELAAVIPSNIPADFWNPVIPPSSSASEPDDVDKPSTSAREPAGANINGPLPGRGRWAGTREGGPGPPSAGTSTQPDGTKKGRAGQKVRWQETAEEKQEQEEGDIGKEERSGPAGNSSQPGGSKRGRAGLQVRRTVPSGAVEEEGLGKAPPTVEGGTNQSSKAPPSVEGSKGHSSKALLSVKGSKGHSSKAPPSVEGSKGRSSKALPSVENTKGHSSKAPPSVEGGKVHSSKAPPSVEGSKGHSSKALPSVEDTKGRSSRAPPSVEGGKGHSSKAPTSVEGSKGRSSKAPHAHSGRSMSGGAAVHGEEEDLADLEEWEQEWILEGSDEDKVGSDCSDQEFIPDRDKRGASKLKKDQNVGGSTAQAGSPGSAPLAGGNASLEAAPKLKKADKKVPARVLPLTRSHDPMVLSQPGDEQYAGGTQVGGGSKRGKAAKRLAGSKRPHPETTPPPVDAKDNGRSSSGSGGSGIWGRICSSLGFGARSGETSTGVLASDGATANPGDGGGEDYSDGDDDNGVLEADLKESAEACKLSGRGGAFPKKSGSGGGPVPAQNRKKAPKQPPRVQAPQVQKADRPSGLSSRKFKRQMKRMAGKVGGGREAATHAVPSELRHLQNSWGTSPTLLSGRSRSGEGRSPPLSSPPLSSPPHGAAAEEGRAKAEGRPGGEKKGAAPNAEDSRGKVEGRSKGIKKGAAPNGVGPATQRVPNGEFSFRARGESRTANRLSEDQAKSQNDRGQNQARPPAKASTGEVQPRQGQAKPPAKISTGEVQPRQGQAKPPAKISTGEVQPKQSHDTNAAGPSLPLPFIAMKPSHSTKPSHSKKPSQDAGPLASKASATAKSNSGGNAGSGTQGRLLRNLNIPTSRQPAKVGVSLKAVKPLKKARTGGGSKERKSVLA